MLKSWGWPEVSILGADQKDCGSGNENDANPSCPQAFNSLVPICMLHLHLSAWTPLYLLSVLRA